MTNDLTKENLKAFADRMATPLDERFAEEQEMIPVWFLEAKDGQIIIVGTPWESDKEKNLAVKFIKQKLKEIDAVRCCHISEVWTLTAPADQGLPESIKLGGRIASHPDRREAVVVVAEDKAGNNLFIKRFILRPEHKKATLSKPEVIDVGNDGDVSGTLTHLFKD